MDVLESSKDLSERMELGSISLSVDSTRRSPSVVVTNDGVLIVSNNPGAGLFVDNGGVLAQGGVSFTSKGVNLKKGEFSENNNSAKPYTYTETVWLEAAVLEKTLGTLQSAGIDTSTINSLIKEGKMPIVTDVNGFPPHVHTIQTFKHVHRIEPSYLYNVPGIFKMFSGFISGFKAFLS